jgi:putative flippase GtrA
MTIKTLLAHNKVRYVLAGGGAFVIEYVIFVALMAVTHALYLSNSISFGIGILAGFVLHKIWSFEGDHRLPVKHQAWIYIVLSLVNLVFTNIVIGFVTDGLHMSPLIGKLAALVFIAVWNYLLFSQVIFRLSSPKGEV